MKKMLIVGLVCINLALILALVLSQGGQAAYAQRKAGPGKYLVTTGKVGTDTDVVYIIDLDKQKFTGWELDGSKGKFMKFNNVKDLATDFK